MPSSIHVKGFEEWNTKLAQLPERMQKSVHKSAVRGGARELIKIAKRNLPGNYTTLKKSLKIRVRRSRKGLIRMRVHPERGKGARHDGWYAHIIEFGSYKHPAGWDIEPWKSKQGVGKKAISFDGQAYGKVHHPGIRPIRFMTRAQDRQLDIINAMVTKGRDAFNKKIKQAWLR